MYPTEYPRSEKLLRFPPLARRQIGTNPTLVWFYGSFSGRAGQFPGRDDTTSARCEVSVSSNDPFPPCPPGQGDFQGETKNLRPGRGKSRSILRTLSLYVGTNICQSRRIMAHFLSTNNCLQLSDSPAVQCIV